MKKIFVTLIALAVVFTPVFVKADNHNNENLNNEKEEVILSQETKYSKTVTEYENVVRDSYGNISSADIVSSRSYEITEEEYNNADLENAVVNRSYTTVETVYKRMTTYLLYENGTYRYKNQVNWLNFPQARNYDIIGIGHYGSVSVSGTPYFLMEYYTVSGAHYYGYFHYNQNFTYGSSATFPLPLENLSSLTVTYYYDVQKTNPNSTIYSQAAFGDYSHSVNTNYSLSDVVNHHVVNQNAGIVLDATIYNYFDTIDEADVYWSGSW